MRDQAFTNRYHGGTLQLLMKEPNQNIYNSAREIERKRKRAISIFCKAKFTKERLNSRRSRRESETPPIILRDPGVKKKRRERNPRLERRCPMIP